MIKRATDAGHLNAILNHPTVRPWVAPKAEGVLDLTGMVADERNVVLMGELGGCAFLWLQPGIYEVHTQVLREGRGKWTRALTEACVRHMFTRTEAYEIVTRVPAGHLAAKAAAEAQGMRFEFTRPEGCLFRDRPTDVHIYSFRLQDWVVRGDGLAETGAWLHSRMEQEADRLGITVPRHDEDPNHNRYVGAAVEMVLGGRPGKGVAFYNRWVSLARQTRGGMLQHVSLVSENPTVIRFDIGLMRFHADDIEVIRSC